MFHTLSHSSSEWTCRTQKCNFSTRMRLGTPRGSHQFLSMLSASPSISWQTQSWTRQCCLCRMCGSRGSARLLDGPVVTGSPCVRSAGVSCGTWQMPYVTSQQGGQRPIRMCAQRRHYVTWRLGGMHMLEEMFFCSDPAPGGASLLWLATIHISEICWTYLGA